MDLAYQMSSRMTPTHDMGNFPPLTHPSWAQPTGGDVVVLERGNFQVRLASNCHGTRSKVSMLVQRLYTWKGLNVSAPPPLKANELTLTVYRDTTLFGTVTLGLDSPSGLLVDQLYEDHIGEYRAQGARVCEITRLAIDPDFNSKEVLAAIFNLTYIYARLVHRMTDVFIEVNPRHTSFYRRMLSFREIGEERWCQRVDAPARLLHMPFDLMDKLIAEFGGRSEASARNLYPHFFAPHEQTGILTRLLQNAPVQAS